MNFKFLSSIITFQIFSTCFCIQVSAQNISPRLLLRDSLDYNKIPTLLNSGASEFSPILYNNGIIYVSNKTTSFNKIGYNKVYWTSLDSLNKVDSIHLEGKYQTTISDNEYVSNDNRILFDINKKTQLKFINSIEAKFVEFIPEHSFTTSANLEFLVYAKKASFKNKEYWQLWQAKLKNGKLRRNRPINIGEKKADYIYPFIFQNELYFASNKKGGKGGYDIYMTIRTKKGWAPEPINLASINSQLNEIAPFKILDSLYFSSNRVGGLGGYDIYLRDKYDQLKNVGYPLNSISDDISFVKQNSNDILVSNRSLTKQDSNLNIYAFLYQPRHIELKGKITLNDGSGIVDNTYLLIKDKEDQAIDTISTTVNGEYSYLGKYNRDYDFIVRSKLGDTTINVNTNASLDFKDNFNSIVSDIQIKDPIKVNFSNSIVTLDSNNFLNIIDSLKSLTKEFIVLHHPFNSDKVIKSDLSEYQRYIDLIKKTDGATIFIASAADCFGSKENNDLVSFKRSKRLYKTFSKLNNNKVILYQLGENLLEKACADFSYDQNNQQANRYSYVFIVRNN